MSALSSLDACLRPEHQGDVGAIREINLSAFASPAEADLVEALRAAAAVTLSAVVVLGATRPAEGRPSTSEQGKLWTGEIYGGEIVGHVMFTPVTVTTDKGEVPLLGLGPVAVMPTRQRHGIGTMMVAGCLEHLRARGQRGVVVVGDPRFYRRFGFIEAGRWGLQCELEVPEDCFMALALTPGLLGGVSGTVRYRPEYG